MLQAEATSADLKRSSSQGGAVSIQVIILCVIAAAAIVAVVLGLVVWCRRRRAAKSCRAEAVHARSVVSSAIPFPLTVEPLRTQVHHTIEETSSTSAIPAMAHEPANQDLFPANVQQQANVGSFSGPAPAYRAVTKASSLEFAEQIEMDEHKI